MLYLFSLPASWGWWAAMYARDIGHSRNGKDPPYFAKNRGGKVFAWLTLQHTKIFLCLFIFVVKWTVYTSNLRVWEFYFIIFTKLERSDNSVWKQLFCIFPNNHARHILLFHWLGNGKIFILNRYISAWKNLGVWLLNWTVYVILNYSTLFSKW